MMSLPLAQDIGHTEWKHHST